MTTSGGIDTVHCSDHQFKKTTKTRPYILLVNSLTTALGKLDILNNHFYHIECSVDAVVSLLL